jgi:hypothetical protein
MNLADYPDKIHHIESLLIAVNTDLAELSTQIQELENVADLDVAYNASLKNELQRKSARWLMLYDSKDYLDLTKRESDTQQEKQRLIADLNHAKNSFAVAKLDRQLEIALQSRD